ncbi:hypothetical protein SAY87_018493 [Trapa incisa]|uniref:RRM domain-containing protein n=1 Tax=Trapa incisa TaxID=236973 RepID=A0AAN7QVF1_9MYRT|nr:hypothetical protein SAY87_018493 [Trapa incisa]
MTMNNNNIVNVSGGNNNNNGNLLLVGVDTTLTKVFVGGLAWETPKEAMREHFEKYGEILEAVIISDKLTGRSKGYGFVTFKEPEAAKKACEDATPVINGRRANCNLASLGARRPKPPSSAPQPGSTVGPRSMASTLAPAPVTNNQVQGYYPAWTPPMAYHHQPHQAAVPFYGYSPTYITPEMIYNNKLSYTGAGAYMNGHYSHHHQVYPGQAMMAGANALMPMYSLYPYHPSPHTVGLPAPVYQPTTAAGPITSVPAALMSKPVSLAPNSVCLAVE